jgi:hypothetical protein
MIGNRRRLAAIIVTGGILLGLCRIEVAHSFIQREYTLQEVLDACTNVAFGRTESVDQKRKRVVVKLEEDIKGKSKFSQIKINVAVGQRARGTSPDMLMSKFRAGLPVILFYERSGSRLSALGYVSGTWFQIFGNDKPDKSRVWWDFTHIEIHMHRTYSGTTEEFQQVVRAAVSGKKWPTAREGDVKVLVLTGNGVQPIRGQADSGTITATAEFLTLKNFSEISKRRVIYQETRDRNLRDLDDAHILWIGVDELGMDGYHLNKAAEDRIKNFVKNGGTVIVSSQDSDTGKSCGNGWIPEHIKGVDQQPSRDLKPTGQAGDILKSPKAIKSGTVNLDDTWTEWSNKFRILATTNNGKNIALATLNYGKGMYLVTALQNETEAYAKANAPLMENIMNFSVKQAATVFPELAAPKGDVKMLVLAGNGIPPVQGDAATVEFLALKKFDRVDKWRVVYQGTKDRGLPNLDNSDILWIGVDEIGRDGYHLNKAAESKIKNFVKGGGIVIVSSQDSDTDKPYRNDWIPEQIKGVEEAARGDFKPTKSAGEIFRKPRVVKPGSVDLDDTWTEWSSKYRVLATTNNGKNIALAMLEYGKGMYLVTALQNESAENAMANSPLMENIIHFSVKWLKSRSG